jgi:hypothetical protein
MKKQGERRFGGTRCMAPVLSGWSPGDPTRIWGSAWIPPFHLQDNKPKALEKRLYFELHPGTMNKQTAT